MPQLASFVGVAFASTLILAALIKRIVNPMQYAGASVGAVCS
jgi:hypothetical protein